MPRRFLSPSGIQVLVGRDAAENHVLSTQVLKSDDMWFHASDVPGAHVVLQVSSSSSQRKPEKADITFCKELALRYSKNGRRVTMVKGGKVKHEPQLPLGTMLII